MIKIIVLSSFILPFLFANLSAQDTTTVRSQINHIAIAVTDLEESEHFYREIIGLKQIPEPFGLGMHAWFDVGGGAELHVISAADERRERNIYNHLCFSVTDMEAFIRKLNDNNVVYSDFGKNAGEITIRPDGVQQIYFTDPDGYWIEVNDDM